LYGAQFPSGSHKVGATYSVLIEKEMFGDVDPGKHTLIWPSTGNYGIGGAYVAGRMGVRSIVVLPAEMSRERFEKIEAYGAEVIKTPGSESNVKEIYDKVHELMLVAGYAQQNSWSWATTGSTTMTVTQLSV
jgi:cysteine synthase